MTDLHPRREIDANDVAGFLRRHPEFLADFPDLAMNLKLPREQGASTSLASYQLEVLRDKTRALTRRLQELIEVAQENEQLMARVHGFTLSLMRAGSLGDTSRSPRAVSTSSRCQRMGHVRRVFQQARTAMRAHQHRQDRIPVRSARTASALRSPHTDP